MRDPIDRHACVYLICLCLCLYWFWWLLFVGHDDDGRVRPESFFALQRSCPPPPFFTTVASMMHVLEDDSEAKVAMPPPRSDRSTTRMLDVARSDIEPHATPSLRNHARTSSADVELNSRPSQLEVSARARSSDTNALGADLHSWATHSRSTRGVCAVGAASVSLLAFGIHWTLESVYRDSKCGPNMQMHVPSILTLDCFFISLNTVFPDTYTCVCSLSLMCSLDHH